LVAGGLVLPEVYSARQLDKPGALDVDRVSDSGAIPACLMPQDQGSSRLAMLSASGIGAQLESGLSSLAGDLSRFQSSSALFVGIWQSRTVRDDIINKLDLKTVDGVQRIEAAREQLSDRSRCFGPCAAPYET